MLISQGPSGHLPGILTWLANERDKIWTPTLQPWKFLKDPAHRGFSFKMMHTQGLENRVCLVFEHYKLQLGSFSEGEGEM